MAEVREDGPLRATAPLAGIRVVDFTRVLAGPFCTMILGDLGADVIKLEPPGTGDNVRAVPPLVGGESHYFLAINRNKRSLAIDLKAPEARDLVLRLVETADIVVENFRPGVMDRLGLGWDALRAVKPDLVMCSQSGFGQEGPMAAKPSFDLVTQALSGVMSLNGEPGGPPTKLGLPMGDIAGGLWGVIGVLAGLQHRNAMGEGLRIDLSLLDGLVGLLGYLAELQLLTGESPGRVGSGHHTIVPYGRYPVKDGHIVLAIHVGAFWRKFCHAIDRPGLIDDARFRTTADRARNRELLETLVRDVLATKTAAEWQAVFDAGDVPAAPVLDVGAALGQAAVRARGLVKTMRHPTAGDVPVVGLPFRFTGRAETGAVAPSPRLGEHSRAVLAELGCGPETFERLLAAGVVGVP